MRFRPADTGDLPGLTRLIAAAYAPYHDAGIDLPDVTGGLDADIAAGRAFVAEREQGLCGVLVVSISAPDAHLMNVAVDPAFRGTGVGRALIAHAETLARQAGARQISLTTHRLMPGNVALYRHLGWQQTGQSGDKVFMTRILTKS